MNHALYKNIFQCTPIGVAYCEVIFDSSRNMIDLNFIEMNEKFKELFNLDKNVVNQTKFSEIFDLKHLSKEMIQNMKDVIESKGKKVFNFHSNILNRHLRVELNFSDCNNFFMFITDITQEINESIEKSILLKATNVVIFELDENYVLTSMHTNYEKDLMINNDLILNTNINDIFQEETASLLMESLDKAKQTQEAQVIRYSAIENDQMKYYEATIFYVKFDHDYRYVVSVKDVSKQKEVEDQLLEMNERFTEIAHQSRTVVWDLDIEGRFIYINSLSFSVFGYSPIEMLGKAFYDFIPDEYRKEYQEIMVDMMRSQEVIQDFEFPHLRKDGTTLWLISSSAPKYNDDQKIIGYRGSYVDITELHNIQVALLKNEERYRFITDNTSDVIWSLNFQSKKFTYISPAVMRLRGFTVEEAMNQSIEESMSRESWVFVQSELEKNLKEYMLHSDQPKDNILVIEQDHKNGTKLWVEISVRFRFNELNEIEIIGISRDVTERKKQEEEIKYLSFHDSLTGLYNRRYFDIEFDRLNTPRNHPISIITADINGLKITNDVFGHSVGDHLIQKAAQILKSGCREDDIIVRQGGDEFLILLPKTSIEDCKHIVERIYQKSKEVKDSKIVVSVSLGYATKMNIDQDINVIINHSDEMMYQNKLVESEIYKRQLLGKVMKRLYKLDPDLRRHLKSLIKLIDQYARAMNFDEQQIAQLKLAAMYHDIGKIGISENDLRLYQSDRKKYEYLLRRQPELSYQILRPIAEYAEIANIVLAYHENYDGSGYPRSLAKQDISREAMMIHIVNEYDKLRYNFGLSDEDVLNELMKKRGNELEPELLDQFFRMAQNNRL